MISSRLVVIVAAHLTPGHVAPPLVLGPPGTPPGNPFPVRADRAAFRSRLLLGGAVNVPGGFPPAGDLLAGLDPLPALHRRLSRARRGVRLLPARGAGPGGLPDGLVGS